jgi:outer membrane protein OmpA-like peptidoglycan-associated protein
VRSTYRRSLAFLIAAFLTLLLPAASHADISSAWLVPGMGAVWPPAEFGVDDPQITFGGILGLRISPPWAVEIRAHFANGDSAKVGGAETRFNHGEGNLTWFLNSESAVSPYLTAGVGAVRIKRQGDTSSKFAWNGGAGLRLRMSDHMNVRIDGRDVSYEVADAGGETKFRHAPEIFGGISFGFGGAPPDEDRDGVLNKTDKCPATPSGARVDASGCPLDGDGDGVFDGIDGCEGTPAGATVDASGCPTDADKDGVFDGVDTCAETPAGARVDATGCPHDSDGDAVLDGLDQCEGTPRGCIVNANGCHTDADQDSVCDGVDKCPDTPPSVRVDLTGCPIQVSVKETQMIETGMIRLQDINFETGKNVIKQESYATLDEVGNILVRWPQLRIEVGGHTDARGSEGLNQRLSEARAKAVLDYLTNKFPQLSAAQFTTVGYGERQPIASNKTALGMAKNRRVEFKVLNKDALKKEIEKQQFVHKE